MTGVDIITAMAETGDPLSERELDVLRCLVHGATNKDIATDLTISENTVKVHLRNIYTKLGVSSRTEATTVAMQQGYITIPGQVEAPAEMSEAAAAAAERDDGESGAGAPIPASAEVVWEAALPLPADSIEPTPARQRWVRIAGIGIAAGLALAAAFFFLGQFVLSEESTPIEEAFVETPIGESRWLESRPMPDPRANMAVASVGLDLYQIGGETADGVDGVVQVFDSLDRSWRTVAEKPTAVADATAAELYGELYVAGGRMPDGRPTAVVEAYSPTQDAWRPVAPLPHPVAGGLTLSDGAFLYVIGGHDGDSFVGASYVYDPASNSWRPLPELPQASALATGGAVAGKLIVGGGENEEGDLASCHIFDPAESSWSACPDMLLARKGAGSAVLLNKLYVIGGAAEEGEVTYSEMFDPESETWQVINTPMLVESGGWAHPGVGQIETRIYALGGQSGEELMANNYVFAPLIYQTYIPAASSPGED